MVKYVPVSTNLADFSRQKSTSSPNNLDLSIALMPSDSTLKEACEAGAGAGRGGSA